MQVFLALPSNCPTDPDGSTRSVDGQTKAESVVLYASADEAQTFEQVGIQHSSFPCQYRHHPCKLMRWIARAPCMLQHSSAIRRSVCQSSGWTWAITLSRHMMVLQRSW